MKLYHGTSDTKLAKILQKGLRPRSKRKGNWKDFPSRPDMIYLTTAYAPYFALNVEGNGQPVVLEIDADKLDENCFFPDEDFISQSIARRNKLPLKEVHDEICRDLERYQEHWQLSVENMGNCCYQGIIPVSAITRYVTWEVEKQSYVSIMAMDPCITPINYHFLSEKYQGLIAWLFGDRQDLPGDPVAERNPEYRAAMLENPYFVEREKYHAEQSQNRESIKITVL
jgi:hypothetical protein